MAASNYVSYNSRFYFWLAYNKHTLMLVGFDILLGHLIQMRLRDGALTCVGELVSFVARHGSARVFDGKGEK